MCTCVVNHGLLESFASDAPSESSVGSFSSNLAVHGMPNPKHKKSRGSEKDGLPIIRATRVLVEGVLLHFSNPKDNVTGKKESLNLTSRRMII